MARQKQIYARPALCAGCRTCANACAVVNRGGRQPLVGSHPHPAKPFRALRISGNLPPLRRAALPGCLHGGMHQQGRRHRTGYPGPEPLCGLLDVCNGLPLRSYKTGLGQPGGHQVQPLPGAKSTCLRRSLPHGSSCFRGAGRCRAGALLYRADGGQLKQGVKR